jgi:flagellar hook-basal body complex protein FliE
MEIQPLSSLIPASAADASGSAANSPAQEGVNSFKNLLDQALQGVDALQQNAQQLAGEVATGDASSFHDAVIASEKALLAVQLTAQVQNKVVAAYTAIMSMQI